MECLPDPDLATTDVRLYRHEEALIFCNIRNGVTSFGECRPDVLHAMARALGRAGSIYEFHGSPHGNTGAAWVRLNARTSLSLLGCVFFAAGAPPALPNAAQQAPNGRACVRLLGLPLSDPPPGFSELLAEAGFFPEARGQLRSCMFPPGEPVPGWLGAPSPAILAPDPAYPHLRRLFAGLSLPERSRRALYSYLFAAHHVVSLNNPRPLLWVDSWEAGVGKTSVCEALAILLDGSPKCFNLPSERGGLDDEITARLISGQRTLIIQNVDGRRRWMSPYLVSLCTDEGQSRRAKYDRAQSTFYGVLPMCSSVLGTTSLHRDMLVRMRRVELWGPPRALHPRPQEYAREHKAELHAEILHALGAAAAFTGPAPSRFGAFDAIGLAAYAVLYPERAAFDWTEHDASCKVYLEAALLSAIQHSPAKEACLQGDCRGDGLKSLEGARGFGQHLKEGQWVSDCSPSEV